MDGGGRRKRRLSAPKAEKESGRESVWNIPAETFTCFAVPFDHVTCSSVLNFLGEMEDEKDKSNEQVKLHLT